MLILYGGANGQENLLLSCLGKPKHFDRILQIDDWSAKSEGQLLADMRLSQIDPKQTAKLLTLKLHERQARAAARNGSRHLLPPERA